MKRRLIVFICILGLLGGCGIQSQVLHLSTPSAAHQGNRLQQPEELDFYAPLYADAQPACLWGREQLSPAAQTAYDRISAAVAARRETPIQVEIGQEEIQKILTALRIDHPEYFWFDGEASFVTSTMAGVTVKTECSLRYTMDLPAIREAHQQVEQYASACLSELARTGAQTDYDKILGVYRYLIETTDYVRTSEDQSILGAMIDHQATCAGYARAFQYLMNQVGIPCVLALGQGAGGEAHGWNMVQCGGAWYQMDVTWGDPVEPDGRPGSSILYTYCLVTDQEIYRDHTLSPEIPMPVCSATDYNYYRRSGRQFDTWDRAAYAAAMTRAADAGETWFSVRFSGRDSYDAAKSALFSSQEIWEILRESAGEDRTHVTYTCNDTFYEISVRLPGTDEGATP